MPFTLIKGTFHVQGYSPDGDSVKFKATKAANWRKLDGNRVRPNRKKHVQVRVEGIDSLETHYKSSHQPLGLAHQATDELLRYLNIRNVTWGPSHSRVTAARDGTRGYILARNTGPYGRPICFVFTGSTSKRDGSDVFLDVALVRKSLNHHMLSVGHAYPLFYETLFYDLRQELSAATKRARAARRGLWSSDRSRRWFSGTNIRVLETTKPVFPKLFRRLIGHKRSGQAFSKFPDRLSGETITILPNVHHTHFDTAVEINGTNVRMKHNPEDLIFGTVIR